ncbi:phage tail length tape measure family protein [Croceicoccus gelatinilyticus]|uniref:phage tail length tape measure family protein n=1 Tax=Croceicoccus gelatinilyticus TaxID=2835536 RepID=UPI001BCB287E|nr:phage tail length tape measure family protein [Croceicoccus gelatinilyticus]MBS7669329.1 phage tail length tape measure family protein [Croceicoccus gelatinilyticus]
MALRVLGIGEVERDFKRVGAAGDAAFSKVARSANGADKEVSEYTARLKRAVAAAKDAIDRSPEFQSLRLQDPAEYQQQRQQTILGAVRMEQNAMREGLGETAAGWESIYQATEEAGPSLTRVAAAGAAAGTALAVAARFVNASAEAYMEHERAVDAFHAKLAMTGNFTEASAAQIEGMAKGVKESTLQTEEAALQAAATLAKVPGLTAAGLQEALQVSALLADALGVDVTEVAESTGKALTALAKNDVKALFEATDGLYPPVKRAILELAELGQTADGQRVYLDGLRQMAGDGPDGLTTASDRLGDSWDRLKTSFGEDASPVAIAMLNGIASALDWVTVRTHEAMTAWRKFQLVRAERSLTAQAEGRGLFSSEASRQSARDQLATVRGKLYQDGAEDGFMFKGNYAETLLSELQGNKGESLSDIEDEIDRRWGDKPKGGGGGRGRRSGKSDAEREAERIKREAEQARVAADRVIESNADVVASYALRAQEAEEKVGLEGAALKAVERRQAIEAAARRINRVEIEKEVEARRAAALAAGTAFDEAAATRAATDAVEEKAEQLRVLAAREIDAADATAEFNKRQAEARAFAEMVKTPLERLNDEVDRWVQGLRDGTATADEFDRRMKQLAEDYADIRYEANESAHAWRGFGEDVGRTLSDLVLNGGSARDVLMELIRLPLERLLFQNIENPVADFIDGLTGNNRDKNVAAARADLPIAGDAAAGSLARVGTEGLLAAQALRALALGTGDDLSQLGAQALGAGGALGTMELGLNRMDGAMMDFVTRIASMSFGGGGGGGGLGGLLSLGISALSASSGGGAGAGAFAGYGDGSNMTGGIMNFASGTDRLPVGRPFWVGENGRELMELTRGGGLRVHSNQQSHQLVSNAGTTIVQQTINVPQQADPRRTGSMINRATQSGLARAARKGLAGSVEK